MENLSPSQCKSTLFVAQKDLSRNTDYVAKTCTFVYKGQSFFFSEHWHSLNEAECTKKVYLIVPIFHHFIKLINRYDSGSRFG